MKRSHLLAAMLFVALSFSAANVAAAGMIHEDTDTRIVEAEVVEVSPTRIAVIARTGVEHVIALDDRRTKVVIDGAEVRLKDVREGDVVTIELDADSPLKLAKNIQVAAGQVARAPR